MRIDLFLVEAFHFFDSLTGERRLQTSENVRSIVEVQMRVANEKNVIGLGDRTERDDLKFDVGFDSKGRGDGTNLQDSVPFGQIVENVRDSLRFLSKVLQMFRLAKVISQGDVVRVEQRESIASVENRFALSNAFALHFHFAGKTEFVHQQGQFALVETRVALLKGVQIGVIT